MLCCAVLCCAVMWCGVNSRKECVVAPFFFLSKSQHHENEPPEIDRDIDQVRGEEKRGGYHHQRNERTKLVNGNENENKENQLSQSILILLLFFRNNGRLRRK